MLQIIQQPDKVFYKCSSKNNTLNCIVKLISNKEGLKKIYNNDIQNFKLIVELLNCDFSKTNNDKILSINEPLDISILEKIKIISLFIIIYIYLFLLYLFFYYFIIYIYLFLIYIIFIIIYIYLFLIYLFFYSFIIYIYFFLIYIYLFLIYLFFYYLYIFTPIIFSFFIIYTKVS